MARQASNKRTATTDKGVGNDKRVDKAADDSFPASDPPAHSGITGVGGHDRGTATSDTDRRPPSHQRDDDARPTGYPTSDRHAAETAHAWEDEEKSKA